MNGVQIAWRDGPATVSGPSGTPAARLLSVILHAAAIAAVLQWSGVPHTIAEQFDEPPLVVSFAAPVPAARSGPPARVAPRPAEPVSRHAFPDRPETAALAAPPGESSLSAAPGLAVGELVPLGPVRWPDALAGGGQQAGTGEAGIATTASGDGRPGASGEAPSTAPLFDAAYLNNPRPAYPDAAVRRGVTGVVMLRVLVSADGRAESVVIEQTSGSRLLDESALQTVRTAWRFVPAQRGGIPVAATVIVPVRFELERR